ncbi:MAG: HDOD domain-containing protein [Pseudazoarcus pumilus]|nr:HDOD domain-containing protein [Pseudazoarcus pumilus]
MSILEKPLSSAQAYVDFLAGQELPVLRQTARQLNAMRENQDAVNARHLAGVVLGDPLFAIRLVIWLERHRNRSRNHDITTLDRAIMMMGIGPFFEAFAELPTVEERLADRPKALIESLHVFGWVRRAAHLARDWAILRHDIDVDEVALATLLRPACEVLLWVFAPPLAEQILEYRKAHPGTRSVVAEHAVLGCSERDIQLGLAHAWHLPALLVTLMDEANGSNPRVRNVALAIDFARHQAEHGWHSPALPEIFTDLLHLLPVGRERMLERLEVPADVIERWDAAADAD